MLVTRAADIPANPGPADWFTGSVTMEPMPQLDAPARVRIARVTFEASARTAWHTHPLGQTLMILSGTCWACVEGGEKSILQPGDVVRFPPHTRHWHGASPNGPMTHIAIQEAEDGATTDWQDKVSDDAYLA